MYNLIFSNQTNLLVGFNLEQFYGIYPIRANASSRVMICMRYGSELIGYEYLPNTTSWHYNWRTVVFDREGDYPITQYPWLVTSILGTGSDQIILRNQQGMRFYQLDTQGATPFLRLLAADGIFHDVSGWNEPNSTILWGRFYPNTALLGVMSRNQQRDIKFYAARKDRILANHTDPLWELQRNLTLTPAWHFPNTSLSLTKLRHHGQEAFVLRTNTGLEFYQFNGSYFLQQVANTSHLKRPEQRQILLEQLLFGNLTNQPYQDIVHLNDSGLFVYQYNSTQQDYLPVHYSSEFSESYGWLPQYSNTVQLLDLNKDGSDDLLFTGLHGLTALTFNSTTPTWQQLLDSSNLSGTQRYATVIGTLPAVPPTILHPLLFIQDIEGKVQSAQVIQSSNIMHSQQRSNQTAMPNTNLTDTIPFAERPIPLHSNTLTIEQTHRKTLTEKPILRWAEQWGNNFLQDAVDASSGQVRFRLPLVDIPSSIGLGLQLAISYHSQVTTERLLGVGWSISLGQDYILVDHQGSIYPEYAKYYLVMQGRPQLLEPISSEGQIRRFQLAEQPEVDIEYHQQEQRWILNDKVEQAIYGKANHSVAADALQWSLAWPNWRGTGRDQSQLQPLVIAWYLNARLAKHNDQALYYHYEIDNAALSNSGKKYSSAVRLKTISDAKQMQLVLDYAPKTEDEYTSPNPIDAQGNINFPVELSQSHYLHGYSLITDSYQQKLRFIYQLDHKQRLLTTIEQQLLPQSETILQFDYQYLLGKSVIKNCKLSSGSMVGFSYATTTTPSLAYAATLRYKAGKQTQIAYGSDYAVMAYHDHISRIGDISFRIMNRELTKAIFESVIDARLPASTTQSPNSNYVLQAYNNSFVVFLENNQNRELYLVNRQEQTWSRPTGHSFSKETLICFDETMIVVAEPNSYQLRLLEAANNQASWNTTMLNIPRPIIQLAIHHRSIVTYDGGQLRLLYRNPQANWASYHIADITSTRQILARFDLADDTRQQLLASLNQHGLQIFNNFISLSVLEEHNSSLLSNVYLFLLDAQHRINQRQKIEVHRENILQLTHNHEYDGSTYRLAYELKDGYFKLKVNGISGKIVEDIKKIRNRNRKEDAMEERLKQLNQHENFQEFFKNNFLLNLKPYVSIQFNSQGVHHDNDAWRITGTGWQRETLAPTQIPLDKHFILESANNDLSLFKLYAQDNRKRKHGKPLKELHLHTPGQLVNRYPAYLAYQTTADSIKILTFKDNGRTLGKEQTFSNEQLILKSDWQNLITTTRESTLEKCLVRPVSTLISPDPQLFINQLKLTADGINQITGYQRYYNRTYSNGLVHSQTVISIPAANKSVSGWYEETQSYHVNSRNVTTSQKWFDASGQLVLPLPKKENSTEESTATNKSSEENPSLLWDRSKQLLISDFSPYSLDDEMTAYYGFESYENNQIGTLIANSSIAKKTWQIVGAQVVEKNFAFTGENYLRLNQTLDANSDFLEGTFQPRYQATTYVASCWLRPSTPLTLNAPAPYLKAILSTTSGHEIVGLLAEVKRQLGDWFYLELLVDFQLVKEIYQSYFDHAHRIASVNNTSAPILLEPEASNFTVTLRVESQPQQIVDLDHIRFFPITHEFQATLYHPSTGKSMAVIQADGLVTRTIYNRLNQKVASLDEDGQLESFTSTSQTGRLVPTPQRGMINHNKPSRLNFQPESGFYETFDTYSLRSRWNLDNPNAWYIAPGQLWHRQGQKQSRIKANSLLFDKAAALRCYIALQGSQASLSWVWQEIGSFQLTRQLGNITSLILPTGSSIVPLPLAGEVIVMLEQNHAWLWLEGVLLFDQTLPVTGTNTDRLNPWASFALEAKDQVLIEDCLVMNRPQLQIEYHNDLGEKTQVIQLEDARTAQVTQTIYDALGRAAITTKTTRVHRSPNQPLLAYRPNFVSKVDPVDQGSVWPTGHLHGEVDRLNPDDQGFAYTRTEYARNPLNEKQILGLPGRDFSITGKYKTRFSRNAEIAFLSNRFPADQGYYQKEKHIQNGSKHVSIFNLQHNQVGLYVQVLGYDHLLSTYEYDTKNRLVKILPPLYHEKVNTFSMLTPCKVGEQHLSIEEKRWQQALATRFSYDELGHLISKTTPDSGRVEYLYNFAGQMRFMASLDTSNQTSQIVYFDYDSLGQLSRTGYLNQTLSISDLQQYLQQQTIPSNAQEYQRVDYADDHPDPLLRGRVKRYITYNKNITANDTPVIEELQFDTKQQIIAKSTLLISEQVEADQLIELKKQYVDGRVYTLEYPVTVNGQPLRLVHRYNRLGQLTGLGTPNNPTYYANFTYYASNQLASEQYQPNTLYNFTRNYHYNSPGFLEQLSDPFLTEKVTYTEKGYGHAGYGDGMVMQTVFNASWPVNADGRWFQIKEDAIADSSEPICIRALKRTGYLSSTGKPVKLYIPKIETALPLICKGKTGERLAELVAEKQIPHYYGHRYAYGNHQELVKAKYFTNEDEASIGPLQPNSFAKAIPSLTTEQSQDIWQLLTNAGYIITDQQRADSSTAIGKRGESVFRDVDLLADLAALRIDHKIDMSSIKLLIISYISQRQTLLLDKFIEVFLTWMGHSDQQSADLLIAQDRKIAKDIYQMLVAKNYLPTPTINISSALNKNFTTILGNYSTFTPNIVRVLSQHFAYALGETAFDVESYKIDANGNHHLFYTGFHRTELTYSPTNNQVQNITIAGPSLLELKQSFPMQHDAGGNVIQALHKGIEHIEYHPTSQRTTKIQLTDGRTLRFYYDAQGERVLKQVLTAKGLLSHETYYLRDEQGRVLVDRHTNYLPKPLHTQQIVTAYLYGPRGLLGFIRNDKFYSVTTDHEGSIRLVIRKGQVVAAYDYLPYGQMMRSYGNDPGVHIMYRYTGQEWDQETGLYNYHARLYDPSIGRFYQPDPKAQYFSPYMYAGNSPISLVDPDGELVLELIIITTAIIGAYLGGAAANNRWNPADWDWEDSGTWLGMIGGRIGGALLPVGIIATGPAAIGLVAGGMYLGGASNQGWDLTKWQWDRPDIWNAMFQGAGTLTGIRGGMKGVHNFANKIFGATGKKAFLFASYSAGGSMAYYAGVRANNGESAFWKWDLSNPATLSALVDGFDTGMGWPQSFGEIGRGLGKLTTKSQKLSKLGKLTSSTTHPLKSILKNPKHPLYKVAGGIVMVYYMGSSANGELDITRWSASEFSTYEGVLNGIFFGKDASSMLKLARSSKLKQQPNTLPSVPKNTENTGTKLWHRLVDNIQGFRREIAYKHLIEEAFAQDKLTHSKLFPQLDNSPNLKTEAENFFKRGLEKWKNGESNPPEALKQLIKKQVHQNVETSLPSKLRKWQADDEQLSQKKRTIFPDRDAEFLGCRRAKRKRRSPKLNFGENCVVASDTDNKTPNPKKQKLILPQSPVTDIKLKPSTDNGYSFELKFKVDGIERKLTCTLDEMLDKLKGQVGANDNIYTPINREYTVDLNSDDTLFTDVGITIKRHDGNEPIYNIIYEGTIKQKKEKITTYIFEQNNREHRRALAELVAYNKYTENMTTDQKKKVQYLIKDEQGVIKVTNIFGNDVAFAPVKSGTGTENDPYTFTNNLPYQDVQVLLARRKEIEEKWASVQNDKSATGYETAKDDKAKLNMIDIFHRNINIAERGRNNLAGILVMIGGNRGLQSLHEKDKKDKKTKVVLVKGHEIGGVKAMLALEDRILTKDKNKRKVHDGYSTKVRNHDDGETVGQIFVNQLTKFMEQKFKDHHISIKEAKTLPELISKILKAERLTGRHSEQQDHGARKKRALMPYLEVDQLESPDNEQSEKLTLNIREEHNTVAASGANRLQFWPINLAKKVGAKIFSLLPTSWTSNTQALPPSEVPNCFSQSQPLITQQIPTTKNGQTILEMGDYLVNNIDMTGNLTWAILLARKWTGYRPAVANLPSDDGKASIALDIRANNLVHEFIDTVLSHALACGIITPVRRIISDNSIIQSAIQIVRKKLDSNQLEVIPQLLCKQVVQQHIAKIAFASTQKQADKLLARVNKDLPALQQQLIQQEQKWLSLNKCLAGRENPLSQPTNYLQNANINMLTQALASMKSEDELSSRSHHPLMPTVRGINATVSFSEM
ncbi:RHS repeat-associated core domain-containing protein [Candidatus Tisiphia endosymbiont of Oplodontha viridula]|uniref:RHS repeat-associated core domain-containing protein n=1 Tax=Candidatus Tisiphia endosymbiont of Oplodontha viridula TaxID=3077925 RepID=UPI0035C8DD8E